MSRGFDSEGAAPLGLQTGGRLSPPASRYMASQDPGRRHSHASSCRIRPFVERMASPSYPNRLRFEQFHSATRRLGSSKFFYWGRPSRPHFSHQAASQTRLRILAAIAALSCGRNRP